MRSDLRRRPSDASSTVCARYSPSPFSATKIFQVSARRGEDFVRAAPAAAAASSSAGEDGRDGLAALRRRARARARERAQAAVAAAEYFSRGRGAVRRVLRVARQAVEHVGGRRVRGGGGAIGRLRARGAQGARPGPALRLRQGFKSGRSRRGARRALDAREVRRRNSAREGSRRELPHQSRRPGRVRRGLQPTLQRKLVAQAVERARGLGRGDARIGLGGGRDRDSAGGRVHARGVALAQDELAFAGSRAHRDAADGRGRIEQGLAQSERGSRGVPRAAAERDGGDSVAARRDRGPADEPAAPRDHRLGETDRVLVAGLARVGREDQPAGGGLAPVESDAAAHGTSGAQRQGQSGKGARLGLGGRAQARIQRAGGGREQDGEKRRGRRAHFARRSARISAVPRGAPLRRTARA